VIEIEVESMEHRDGVGQCPVGVTERATKSSLCASVFDVAHCMESSSRSRIRAR
jgi:hypothetical protein